MGEFDFWHPVRQLRAGPPGKAARGTRKKAFSAGVQQAEDFTVSAHHTGPWTKPILLYYAFAQAGRAALAAHGPDNSWNMSGHGITELAPDTRAGVDDHLLNYGVTSKSDGLYQAFSAVVNEPAITEPVTLRQLWSAIPDLQLVPPPGGHAVEPLYLEREVMSGGFVVEISQAARATMFSRGEDVLSPEEFRDTLSNTYGVPADWSFYQPQNTPPQMRHAHGRWGFVMEWQCPRPDPGSYGIGEPERIERLNQVAQPYRYQEWRPILPLLGGADLSPMMAWWLALYCLSCIARYRPAVWRSALDLDNSATAAPLVRMMDIACEVLPHLVYDALELTAHLLPPSASATRR